MIANTLSVVSQRTWFVLSIFVVVAGIATVFLFFGAQYNTNDIALLAFICPVVFGAAIRIIGSLEIVVAVVIAIVAVRVIGGGEDLASSSLVGAYAVVTGAIFGGLFGAYTRTENRADSGKPEVTVVSDDKLVMPRDKRVEYYGVSVVAVIIALVLYLSCGLAAAYVASMPPPKVVALLGIMVSPETVILGTFGIATLLYVTGMSAMSKSVYEASVRRLTYALAAILLVGGGAFIVVVSMHEGFSSKLWGGLLGFVAGVMIPMRVLISFLRWVLRKNVATTVEVETKPEEKGQIHFYIDDQKQ